jgi:hypothetical protein
MDSKELRGLAEAYQAVHAPQEVEEAVYGGDPKKPAAPKDDRMVVTNADKKANTKAYQNFKAGVKGYKSADHLGEGVRDLDPEKGTAERKARLEKKREMKLDDHPEYKKEKSVDEAVKGASRHDTEMRKAASKERKSGIKNRLSPAAGKDNADKMQRDVKFFDKLTKKNRNVVGLVAKEEVDIFDTILEYLVAEGYADTNESALVIMANMSEEWRQSIVEGDNYDKNRKRAAQRAAERNAARDRGQTGAVPGVGYVTPRRERETYVDAAGTTRHKSGAKMP